MTTAFRPWGIDALATIVASSASEVTIRYDHEETVTYTLTRRDLDRIGRMVTRTDYQRGKRPTPLGHHRPQAPRVATEPPARYRHPTEARLDALHATAALYQ